MVALTHLTGDFPHAVRIAGEVLRIRGQVLPSTEALVHLVAETASGQKVVGESAISVAGPPRRLALSPSNPPALPAAMEAIRQADLVVLGPGSLFTSIIPNLLVPGIAKALGQREGLTVYVANLVTQPGETTGLSLRDHVGALLDYAPSLRLDAVLANEHPLPEEAASRYWEAGAKWVGPEEIPGVKVVCRDLLTVAEDGTVRHDPHRLAQALWELFGGKN